MRRSLPRRLGPQPHALSGWSILRAMAPGGRRRRPGIASREVGIVGRVKHWGDRRPLQRCGHRKKSAPGFRCGAPNGRQKDANDALPVLEPLPAKTRAKKPRGMRPSASAALTVPSDLEVVVLACPDLPHRAGVASTSDDGGSSCRTVARVERPWTKRRSSALPAARRSSRRLRLHLLHSQSRPSRLSRLRALHPHLLPNQSRPSRPRWQPGQSRPSQPSRRTTPQRTPTGRRAAVRRISVSARGAARSAPPPKPHDLGRVLTPARVPAQPQRVALDHAERPARISRAAGILKSRQKGQKAKVGRRTRRGG